MLRFPLHLRTSVAGSAFQAVERLPALAIARRCSFSTQALSVEPGMNAPPPPVFPGGDAHPAQQGPSSPAVAGAGAVDFEQTLQLLAREKATPVSLTNLFRSALHPTPQQSLLNAQFLWRELRVRFAHRAKQLRELPPQLSQHPCMVEAADTYTRMTALLLTCPKPRTPADEEAFARVLAATRPTSHLIPHKIGVALADVHRSQPLSPEEQREVNLSLDAFFMSRVGHRLLIQHYLCSKKHREGFAGIIQSHCSPVTVCESVARNVKELVRERCGMCPEIHVIGERNHTFTYVPSHIYFIANELLKNAASATVRQHRGKGQDALPPVRVIVVRGEHDVNIKVEDEGGGMARSKLKEIWSYTGHWTETDDSPDLDPTPAPTVGGDAAPIARHGLGLPLARLYAKYFGGTLHVTPMEGYGTDCYVKLNRLGDHNCENLPSVVRTSPGERDSLPPPVGCGLFDAQAKR